jgi:hypothetical protein
MPPACLGAARRRRWNHAEAQEIEYVLVYHESGAEEKKGMETRTLYCYSGSNKSQGFCSIDFLWWRGRLIRR